MALPTQRTLQHLRQELRVLCGMNSQISTPAQLALFGSFVTRAQDDIYWQHKFREQRVLTEISTVADQQFYDWPDVVDPSRSFDIQVLVDNTWLPLRPKGINYMHDTVTQSGQTSHPTRYDDGPQLEVWPVPDKVYTLRIEHYTRPRLLYDPAARVTATAYVVGDRVIPASGVIVWPTPLPPDPHLSHFTYECTTAGTTAGGEPTWPVVDGGTVTDGTVTWTARLNTFGVPSLLVERLALYLANLRYRQPEAEAALGSFQQVLYAMQAAQNDDRRFFSGRRRQRYDETTAIEPVRV